MTMVEKQLNAFPAWIGLAAVTGDPGVWLGVDQLGLVTRLNTLTDQSVEICQLDWPIAEAGHQPFNGHLLTRRVHVSGTGRFAAIVNDYGRYGKVYDLETGTATMELDGGDYCSETVPFSCAFVEHDGQTVVIHRTDWNRLDASLAQTGELLTQRGPTSFMRNEPRPEHDLDYFHGAVHLSPSGDWIVDDGWFWHPVGIPTIWNVRQWLNNNAWESDDGPTKAALAFRDGYWDHPMCWLDDDRLAITGIGDDVHGMTVGARVLAVHEHIERPESRLRAARTVQDIPGPDGQLFSDGDRLFCLGPAGLQVWDSRSGVCVGHIEGFKPTHQHPGSRELIQISGRPPRLKVWRY